MVNGLHVYSAFIQSAVQLMPPIHPFTHTFTHQRRLAAMQGTDQLVRSNWGLGVLLRTLRHAWGGIEPATLRLPDDSSHLLSHAQTLKHYAPQSVSHMLGSQVISHSPQRLLTPGWGPAHFLLFFRCLPLPLLWNTERAVTMVTLSAGSLSSPLLLLRAGLGGLSLGWSLLGVSFRSESPPPPSCSALGKRGTSPEPRNPPAHPAGPPAASSAFPS